MLENTLISQCGLPWAAEECAEKLWAGVGGGVGEKCAGGEEGAAGERLVLFFPWMDFPGEEKGPCFPPCLAPHSAGADVLVQQLDHWVPATDLQRAWLSPEGHGIRQAAIENEGPEGQTLMLFLQSLAMGCNAIPRMDALSWAIQRTAIQFPTQQGSCQKGEMLEMNHCQLGICWLMTGRTWVAV